MTKHEGEHPRKGGNRRRPFVLLKITLQLNALRSLSAAERINRELGYSNLPFGEDAATRPERRTYER